MARQVLTLPDVPSTLLTQSVAAATYLPLSHAPGTDPHPQYLNQSRGDLRYSLLAHNHDAAYSALAHTHTGVYSPVAHNHDATYVNTTGTDTMSGNLGIGVTPEAAWSSAWSALRVGFGGALWSYGTVGTTFLSNNSYYDGTDFRAIRNAAGNSIFMQDSTGSIYFQTAPAVAAGAIQTYTTRMSIDAAGLTNMSNGLVVAKGTASYAIETSGGDTMIRGGFGTHYANPAFNVSAGWKYVDGTGLNHTVNGASQGTYFSNNGSVYVSGTVTSRAGTENLAGMWLDDNVSAHRSFVGLEGDYVTWRVYSNSRPGNVLSINLNDSYVSIPGGVGITGQITTSAGINGNGGVFTIASTANTMFAPAGGIVHPDTQGTRYLGHTSLHWAYFYIYNIYNDVGGVPLNIQSSWHLNLTSTAAWVNLKSAGHVFFDGADSNIVAPNVDNKLICGGTGNRWKYVAAVQGGINTSHASFKEKFQLLGGKACERAVLETDWVSFEYKPSPDPEPDEDEEPQKWIKRRDDHRKLQDRDAFTRRQKGYVLGHGSHKVSPLFGLEDREHASPSSDLAVVACALQSALKRIAALEEKLSV